MPEVNFYYKGNKTTIICEEKDILKEVFNKFINKSKVQNKRIKFFFNEKIADENKTVDQMTKDKSLNIIALDKEYSPPQKINNIKQSNEVIYQKSKYNTFFKINDNKMNLHFNKNGLAFNNILFKNFKKAKEKDSNKIKCLHCKNKNRNNSYNNNKIFRYHNCEGCKIEHDKTHIINYNEGNNRCNIHNEIYAYYCKTCKVNICLNCKKAHNEHELIKYENKLTKENATQNYINNFRKRIAQSKDKINEKSNYIKNIKMNFVNFKNIKKKMDNNNKIIENNNNKLDDLIDIYKKTNNVNNNYSKIIYKINKSNDNIRIFGNEFVKNNKNKIKLEIEGKEYELIEYYKINDNNILEIEIKGIENITNFSYMFCGCSSLSHINLSNFNTINVTNMSCMFSWCSSLSNISDISIWDTKNVTNMNSMFCGCSSLLQLPDISNWNINNVINLNSMFYKCSSLLFLPNISKWNTTNVINMEYIFYKCSSLLSLPDLSKWNTKNVTNMCSMFSGCSSLLNLPDISKWNTNNVTNINNIFNGCLSLSNLPKISKWDSTNLIDTDDIFEDCLSLVKIPKELFE